MGGVNLFPILAFCILTAVLAVFLRESRLKTAGILLSVAAGSLVFLQLLPSLAALVEHFSALAETAGAEDGQLQILIKAICIAYLAEFGGQLCRDAGEGASALKIEMAARVAILMLAVPVLEGVVGDMLQLLSWSP